MKDYTSPIEMITNSIIKSNEEQLDDFLLFSVEREIGFKVDKEELVKALEYDRKQYEKGFEDGLKSAAEWIPVSERLPEEETDVLVCNANGDIELSRGSYSTEMKNEFIWYTSGWRFGKVVAWMPLPKCFEGNAK